MSRTFVDAIVPDGGRKYTLTANADGTTSIEDVTQYLQVGDKWGAAEANEVFATAEAAETTATAANATAQAAQTTAATAQATADGKVSKTGDTMTGALQIMMAGGLAAIFASEHGVYINATAGDFNCNRYLYIGNPTSRPTEEASLVIHTTTDGGYGIDYAVLHSGNFANYAMPKTGGTFTGNVDIAINQGFTVPLSNGQFVAYYSNGADGRISRLNPDRSDVGPYIQFLQDGNIYYGSGYFTGAAYAKGLVGGISLHNCGVWQSDGYTMAVTNDLRFIRK